MNVLVTLETRFDGGPDGSVWTRWGQGSYSFFTRYLDVFDEVLVVARVKRTDCLVSTWERADGHGVRFVPIPYYLGPTQFATRAYKIYQVMRHAVSSADAVILRVPSIIGTMASLVLKHSCRPYGLEVVADPYDGFARGAVKHPLRPFFRVLFSRELERQCRSACAVAYVTKEALQKRYSAGPGVFHTSYSDVELTPDAFVSKPLQRDYKKEPFRLLHVGTMTQLYKAPDVLLQAFGKCCRAGLSLHLTLIGDGQYRDSLERLAVSLGIRDRVLFLGQLPPGPSIREQLDRAHLFVLPSRTEGMPRAMIEAMARGLPCIGSSIGGIPELLETEDLVPPGDPGALATKICEIVKDPDRMERMSLRNRDKAGEYDEKNVRKPRVEFYRSVREKTENWRLTRSNR